MTLAKREPAELTHPIDLSDIAEMERSFALAIRQRDLLGDYITSRMVAGKHTYKVGNDKPSLTKEGAELICLPHNLVPDYAILSGPNEPPADNAAYQITVKCSLLHKGDGRFGGSAIGSASSYQTTRDGAFQPRQRDPGLCHNATLKMAEKSAYIAATLNATAASEFFTQDLEDVRSPGGGSRPDTTTDVDPVDACPDHGKPWRESSRGKYCATKLEDGSWCKQRPPAAAREGVRAASKPAATPTQEAFDPEPEQAPPAGQQDDLRW
jgi:hypothetical protein